MPFATDNTGRLQYLDDFFIDIPNPNDGGYIRIKMQSIPEISESKAANYADEPVIGRSLPITSYSFSDSRIISIKMTFYLTQDYTDNPFDGDQAGETLKYIRAIQSACYPKKGKDQEAYKPPAVCRLQCGHLLGDKKTKYVCAVLQDYQIAYDNTVPWNVKYYIPYKLDISTNWKTVFSSSALPGAEDIIAPFSY